jgi:hypothetical protein
MKKSKYDVGNNEGLNEALNVLYQDAMMSDAVQEFAKNHPGVQMSISAKVTVEVTGRPACAVVGQYAGYILKSEGAKRETL